MPRISRANDNKGFFGQLVSPHSLRSQSSNSRSSLQCHFIRQHEIAYLYFFILLKFSTLPEVPFLRLRTFPLLKKGKPFLRSKTAAFFLETVVRICAEVSALFPSNVAERAAHKSRDGPPGSLAYLITFSTSHRTRRFLFREEVTAHMGIACGFRDGAFLGRARSRRRVRRDLFLAISAPGWLLACRLNKP